MTGWHTDRKLALVWPSCGRAQAHVAHRGVGSLRGEYLGKDGKDRTSLLARTTFAPALHLAVPCATRSRVTHALAPRRLARVRGVTRGWGRLRPCSPCPPCTMWPRCGRPLGAVAAAVCRAHAVADIAGAEYKEG